MKKTVEELRAIVRNIRAGQEAEGFVLAGDVLEDVENAVRYKVSGVFRIAVEEIGDEYDRNREQFPENDEGTEPFKDDVAIPPARVTKGRKKSDRPRGEDGKILRTETRTCTQCGKEFEGSIYNKRDLCYDCKPKSVVSVKKSDRPRDENGKVVTVETRTCPKCGKTFDISIYSGRKECYDCAPVKSKSKSKAMKDADGNTVKVVAAVCDKCGNKFVRSIYNPYHTTCPDCRKSSKPRAEDVVKVCATCGQEFTVSRFSTPAQKAEEHCKKCRKQLKKASA